MQLKFGLILVLALGCLHGIVAQETFSGFDKQASASVSNQPGSNNADTKSWTVYLDEENQVYYIDFEALQVNISDVVVKNDQGNVVMKDDVFDLPVNTIYELDLTRFSSGKYELELRSFTGVIQRAAFSRP